MTHAAKIRVLAAGGLVLLAAAMLVVRHASPVAPWTQLGGGAAAVVQNAPGRLTVTFWNLDWFPGQRPNAPEAKRRAHVAAVVPIAERLNPDILGLEEVADRSAAQLIVEHLQGFKVDVCSEFTRDGLPGGQQEVLCSRLPLIAGSWEPWKPGRDGLLAPRGFAFAAYRLPAGGIALVYGLHLKSNRIDHGEGSPEVNMAEREEAMRQLRVHQAVQTAAYGRDGSVGLTIIGGDMNTSLDDPRFAAETTLRDLRAQSAFRWAWEGVPADARLTLPGEGRYPATCFDHIFFRGERARLLGCSLEASGREASDHRPVTAIFQVQAPPKSR